MLYGTWEQKFKPCYFLQKQENVELWKMESTECEPEQLFFLPLVTSVYMEVGT